MVKIWVNVAQSSGTNRGGPFLLRSQGDFATFAEKATPVGADIVLVEDSAANGSKVRVQLGNITTTNAVTAAATLTASVLTVGVDGTRKIKDNTGGVTLVGTEIAGLLTLANLTGQNVLSFTNFGASAVNWLDFSNRNTGNNPRIAALGEAGRGIDFRGSSAAGIFFFDGTACIQVPDGTTAQRPAAPEVGMIRYNTTTGEFEGYDGAWSSLGGGGGAGDVVGPGSATDNAIARFDTGTGKLIQNSVLTVADIGVSANNVDFLTINNEVSGTADTESSILWRQDDSTLAPHDAGRISVVTEQNWTGTGTTRDSAMTFHASLDGTVSEVARFTSSGKLGIGTTTPGSILSVDAIDISRDGASVGYGAYSFRDTITSVSYLSMGRARGTRASPVTLNDNDNIARFFARGWTGTQWLSPGRLDWLVDGAVSSGVMPIEFKVSTGSSAGAGTVRLTVRAAGGIEVSGSQTMTFNGANNSIQATTTSIMDIESGILTMNGTASVELHVGGNAVCAATSASTSLLRSGTIFLQGNATGIGFSNVTPIVRPNYTVTNLTPDRVLNASSTSVAELGQVVGTIIQDLIDYGLYQ